MADIERDLAREELKIASGAKRVKAFLTDLCLMCAVFAAALGDKLFFAAEPLSDAEIIAIVNENILWIIGLNIVYQTAFIAIYGATIGKIWQRIMVISIDTLAKPTIGAAISRSLMRVVSDFCFCYGFIWAFLNPLRQTWHDKISRTIVIDA